MKKYKLFIAATLISTLILGMMPCVNVGAVSVKLNKKSLSLTVGKSKTLKLKNLKKGQKVKWSSSSKKIASVNKKGKVTAKKAGKAKITAKAGKAKYVCKVTVKAKKSTKKNALNTPIPTAGNAPTSNVPATQEPVITPTPATNTEEPPKDDKILIYDLAQEEGMVLDENGDVPVVCPYSESDRPYCIWKCPMIIDDTSATGVDYRGKKLHVELALKNTGIRNLPELGVTFNYTYPVIYPLVYYIYESEAMATQFIPPEPPSMEECEKYYQDWGFDSPEEYYDMMYTEYLDQLEGFNAKLENTIVENKQIAIGEKLEIKFDITIPENAFNGDKDPETSLNYPIQMLVENFGNWKEGDEVTILSCKIYKYFG